jgi:hypothetical protein
MVMGVCVVQLGVAPAASAEVVNLGCDVTVGGAPVALDVAVDTDDPALDGYGTGDLLALHSVDGPLSAVPAPADELGTSPICAVEVQRDAGGVLSFAEPGWMWCMQYEVDACVGGPGTDQGDVAAVLQPDDPAVLPDASTRLSIEQKSQLVVWATMAPREDGVTEQAELIAWQNRIWCITDGESDIPATVPGPYVPDDPSTGDCAGFRTWLQANVLPFFADADDSISITIDGPSTTTTNDVLRFRLTSTVPTVRIGVNEELPGDICPEDTSGATLADSVVTMTPGSTVLLCALSEKVADYTLVGSAELVVGDSAGQAFRFDDAGCQVMLTSDSTLEQLASDTIVLSWTAAPPRPSATPDSGRAAPSRAQPLAFVG